ncbi:MAG: tetratricopeptide repeat protein [Chitinivibrionales bacterium]|nr:tetratricopeptide repeat protein [Chitinivibrionales bacterium]
MNKSACATSFLIMVVVFCTFAQQGLDTLTFLEVQQQKTAAEKTNSTAPTDLKHVSIDTTSAQPTGPVVLFISRAGENSSRSQISDGWISALLEYYYTLKTGCVDRITTVSRQKISKAMPKVDPFGLVFTEEELFSAAAKTDASHILIHSYDFDRRNQNVNYFLELIQLTDKKAVMTFDKNFPLGQLEKNLDECLQLIVKTLRVPLSGEAAEMIQRPAFTKDIRLLTGFSQTYLEDEDTPDQKSIEKLVAIVTNEPGFAIATLRAGQIFEQLQNCEQAAGYFNRLIIRNGFLSAQLCMAASKNYRLCQSYDRAERVLALARSKGYKSAEMILEEAQLMQKNNKPAQAYKLYYEILSLDSNQTDALINVARQLRLQGDAEAALRLVDRAVDHADHDQLCAAYLEKGEIFSALKKTSEALDNLALSQDCFQNDPRPTILMGDLYLENKDFEKAAACFQKAMEKDPRNIEFLLKIIRSYKQAGLAKPGLTVIDKYKNNFVGSRILKKETGILAFMAGDSATARPLLESSTSLDPPDSAVFLSLGQMYANAAEYDKAVRMLERAETLVKDKTTIDMSLGHLYFMQKNYVSAKKKFLSILDRRPDHPQVNRYLGQIARINHDDKQALTYFLAHRKVSGDDETVQQNIAEIYFSQNDLVNAEKESQKLLTLNSNSPTAYIQLSVIALKKKKIADAESYIAKAESLERIDAALYKELAKILTAANFTEKAIKAYGTYLKQVPEDGEALIELSKLYEKTKNDTLTAQTFEKIYQVKPGLYQSYLSRAGHLYFKLGMTPQAYNAYSLYINKNPGIDTTIFLNMGQMEYEKKNYDKAIYYLKNIHPKSAPKVPIVKILAFSAYSLGKYREALPYLKQYHAVYPTDPEGIEMLATVHEKNADTAAAIVMYQKYVTLKKADKQQEYAFHLASLYHQQKLTTQAINQYQQNILRFPEDLRNYEQLTTLYTETKQHPQAILLLEKAIKVPNAPYDFDKMLAQLYLDRGKKTLAAETYERYVKNVAHDSTAWATLGTIYFSMESYDNAIASLSRAVELMPKNFECQRMLGVSYYKTNTIQKAIPTLQIANQLNRKNIEVLTLLTNCFESIKDTAALIGVLTMQSQAESGNFNLLLRLGRLLVATDKTLDAIAILENASKITPSNVDVHMLLVELYRQQKNSKKEYEHITEAVRFAPNDANVNYEKALYHLAENEKTQAKSCLQKTIALDPKHDRAHFSLASILEKENNFKTAYFNYTQAVKYNPKNVEYLTGFARVAAQTGKTAEALSTINKALNLEPDNQELLQWAGYLHYQAGEYKKAEQYLMAGASSKKECSFCNKFLGLIYYQRTDYLTATTYLEKAIRTETVDDSLLMVLAQAYELTKNPKKAYQYYDKAYTNNPQNDKAFYKLCAMTIDMENGKEVENLIKNNPSRARTGWVYLAEARFQELQGRNALAVNSYNKALQLLPDNFDAQVGLGRIYLLQENYNAAVKSFSKAMIERSDDLELIVSLGKAYVGLKDYASAKELFMEAINRQQNYANAYNMLGLVYGKLQKFDQAIEILNEGLVYDSKNSDIHFTLGLIYDKITNYEDAIDHFNKAVRLDISKEVVAYEHIGDIYYFNLKRTGDAKRYYKKYLKAGGNNSRIKRLVETM